MCIAVYQSLFDFERLDFYSETLELLSLYQHSLIAAVAWLLLEMLQNSTFMLVPQLQVTLMVQ